LIEGQTVRGVVTVTGITFEATAVVLTVGTSSVDESMWGSTTTRVAGLAIRPPIAWRPRLRDLALRVGRLKTGTPPRIDGRTLDFSVMAAQPGDTPTPVFSFLGRDSEHPRQVNCFITGNKRADARDLRAANRSLADVHRPH